MISVIIPTLNAEKYLPAALTALVPGVVGELVKEVIIVDAGSTDATLQIAEAMGAQVIAGPKGRGAQMATGAAQARGTFLLFLHADTVLSADWQNVVSRALDHAQSSEKAFVFKFRFDDDSHAARRVAFWVGVRFALMRLPYGDQGLLLAKSFYDQMGGFRPLPFLEDVDFVRRIGRKRLFLLDATAVTSADKYRRDGYAKRSWRNLMIVILYYCGVSPERLAKYYS